MQFLILQRILNGVRLKKYFQNIIKTVSLKISSRTGNKKAKEYVRKTKKAIKVVAEGAESEARETRDMADSFFRLLSSKLKLDERSSPPSEEEVKAAIEQLKDIGRISIFASVSILPGGGFSLIGLELLARKYGIKNFTFVPSSFRKKNEKTNSIINKYKRG